MRHRSRLRRCARRLAGALLLLLAASGCPRPRLVVSPEIAPEGVVFRYRAPSARLVQVSGTWDTNFQLRGRDWTRDTRVGCMQDEDHDGVWELRVPLGPGRYEYSFLVDGRFLDTDPANPQRVPDAKGGWLSVLVMP